MSIRELTEAAYWISLFFESLPLLAAVLAGGLAAWVTIRLSRRADRRWQQTTATDEPIPHFLLDPAPRIDTRPGTDLVALVALQRTWELPAKEGQR